MYTRFEQSLLCANALSAGGLAIEGTLAGERKGYRKKDAEIIM